MTARDLRWRSAGIVLGIAGCVGSVLDRDGSPLTIGYFLLAITGIVMLLNGKRVGIALRAERRGHGDTAAAIHARRADRGDRRQRR